VESFLGSRMEQEAGGSDRLAAGGDGEARGGARAAAGSDRGVASCMTGDEEESPACSPLRLRPVSRLVFKDHSFPHYIAPNDRKLSLLLRSA